MAPAEMNKKPAEEIDKRPNYFAGQYLLEEDFRLEQEYHIDRQRRHNHLLHVSGIATGLKVELGKELKVTVTAGTAIDFQGKQIILIGNKNVDLEQDAHNKNPIQNGDYILSIKYNEELTAPQGNEANAMSRVQEKPVFELSDPATANVIALAKLTIKGKEVEKIDPSVRQYSGINLPTEDGKGVTLRSSHGNENPNLAVLTGSLSISGALEVKGGSTLTGNVKANGSLTVSNKGKGWIAEFTQQGEGGGVYIGGVKGEHNALNIAGNETIHPTLAVANKGSGLIAQFIQQGEGNGVMIRGVKGDNNALYIDKNKTEKPTVYVENEGKGTTLEVRQKGTGKAAEFKGKVTVDGAAELNGSLSISGALAVTGDLTIKQNHVTTGANKFCIICGRVYSNGNVIGNTEGFHVVKSQSQDGRGYYQVIFNNPFTAIPAVVATQCFSDNTETKEVKSKGGSTLDNAVVVTVNQEFFSIITGKNDGNLDNRGFGFIVIGIR